MKRTVTISVPTLVLLGVVAVLALGIVTTTNSSAQASDDDAPWVLQPNRTSSAHPDRAYLFNIRTGEVFLISEGGKYLVKPKELKKKK